MAGRVCEVAGLQVESLDFTERVVTVQHSLIWSRSAKQFDYLKDLPKNGEKRFVFMNDRLFEILRRRANISKNSYVFHDDFVNPLSYRKIQYRYNMALKKIGLYPEFSSTHIMRHSMGTITRKITGSLDAAQAVTGHKVIKMAQHYASVPSDANKNAVKEVESFMKKLSTLQNSFED